jgi:1-acyl-sn-glycerol-3-phosphate acyltransferase
MVEYYNPLVQKCVREFADLIFRSYFRINMDGKENIPEKGPAIFSFNHVHSLDTFIIGGRVKSIRYAMAKKELFPPLAGALMRMIGSYPVDTKPWSVKQRELSRNYSLLIPKSKHAELLQDINQLLGEELKDLSGLDHRLFTEYLLSKGGRVIMHLPGTREASYEKSTHPKKGAAWKALDMLDKHNLVVPIIPGGIVYSNNKKPIITKSHVLPFRTRVDISFGSPVTAEEHLLGFRQSPGRAALDLTMIINEEVNKKVKEIIKNL